jgi:hypothetical protein
MCGPALEFAVAYAAPDIEEYLAEREQQTAPPQDPNNNQNIEEKSSEPEEGTTVPIQHWCSII